MLAASTLRTLPFEEVLANVDKGAALVDLRLIEPYLEVHVPGSLELLYEFGPGMAGRARDCLPVSLPLILLDLGRGDAVNAAASLRGKGFAVLGKAEDGINQWAATRGPPASTEVLHQEPSPEGLVLDVGDPGAHAPESALRIPIELLWSRAQEATGRGPVAVAAGYGVRAALAVGILERKGAEEIVFWKRR
jgi:rhodanese-related sulfurtransferase